MGPHCPVIIDENRVTGRDGKAFDRTKSTEFRHLCATKKPARVNAQRRIAPATRAAGIGAVRRANSATVSPGAASGVSFGVIHER